MIDNGTEGSVDSKIKVLKHPEIYKSYKNLEKYKHTSNGEF